MKAFTNTGCEVLLLQDNFPIVSDLVSVVLPSDSDEAVSGVVTEELGIYTGVRVRLDAADIDVRLYWNRDDCPDLPQDFFAEDRDKLTKACEEIGEWGVMLGEWQAENVFGDPGLRDAMHLVGAAEGAMRAAFSLVALAVAALPTPS